MRKLFINSLFAMLVAAAAPVLAAQTDNQTDSRAGQTNDIDEGRKIAQEFMQRLGGALKAQLEKGGADTAISVCKNIAPALAAEYSKEGRMVSRVSLKTRNKTLGTPDAWERGVLQKFDQEQRDGKTAAAMETTDIVEGEDGRWFRYMKAIPAQPMCLQCHGKPDEIAANVKAVLAREYPEDRAVGYSASDIRGAISIKRRLQGTAE